MNTTNEINMQVKKLKRRLPDMTTDELLSQAEEILARLPDAVKSNDDSLERLAAYAPLIYDEIGRRKYETGVESWWRSPVGVS